MPVNKLTIQIDCDASCVALAAECVRAYCNHHCVDESTLFQIVTCVMEALNNVIEHAAYERPGERIYVVCMIVKNQVIVQMIDRGGPMRETPPLAAPGLNAEHGRGWLIMRGWMDAIIYRRRRGENFLQLRKAFPSAATG
jgi:anti-sigma regulatory factor (Ser/Thr protein kinase)